MMLAMENRISKEFPEETQIYYEYIEKCGLRKTAQRDLILGIFLRTHEHLSSEDLYWLVHKEDSDVGQTTVYRTLKLLTEAGLAREVRLGDGRTYYEHHHNHDHHDHLICTDCGDVIEFFSAEIEELQDQMAAKFKFKPTHHSLRILGVCEACQQNVEKQIAPGSQPRIRVKSHIAG
jgi:Fur family transcriptional regulator, ferric uptake regulator